MADAFNPYAAPTADPNKDLPAAPATNSFARRVSLILGGVGIASFGLLAVMVIYFPLLPLVVVLAYAMMLSPIVGFTVVFAAPPEKRQAGLLLNGTILFLYVVIILLARTFRPIP